MSQAQRCTCPSIPGICLEQPGHFSLLHIPGFCDPAGHSGIPVMLVTPPQTNRGPRPLLQTLQRVRKQLWGCCASERRFGVFLPGPTLISWWGWQGDSGVATGHTSPPDVPACMNPCLGNPSPSLPRFDGSIPFPPSPPSTPQPRPHTWIGTGINFSAGFGCWSF